jgi:hypothetical protein
MSQSAVKLAEERATSSHEGGICEAKKVWFYAGGGLDLPIIHRFDLVFCEDKWTQREFRKRGVDAKIAFGINTQIYHEIKGIKKAWEYIYPAAFAAWKRHNLFINKVTNEATTGICVGQIVENERWIFDGCIEAGMTVLPKVTPEVVNYLYNQSDKVYLPASLWGGCQRALMEARHLGLKVIVEEDNPRLMEMLNEEARSEKDYLDMVIKEIKNL